MAGSIKGITIEIGGDTTPLQKALQGVNRESSQTTKELKQIDKALKFDTGNMTLLSQKQEVLTKQIEATKDKLTLLRQAQGQVEDQFKSGAIGAEQYRSFHRELETTQSVLKHYESNLEQVNRSLGDHTVAVDSTKSKLANLQAEQAQLVSESERVASSFKLQERQLGANADESDKLALAQKRVVAQSEVLERQIKNLEQQLELTKSEYGENSVEANKLEKTLNETKTAFHSLHEEMGDLSNSSATVKDSLAETNSYLKADILMEFGDKLGELSQKLIDFGQSALEAFREVDEGMDIIVTKTGATGQALDELTGIAESLATELPTDFTTAGNAVGELNKQFGFTGKELESASSHLIQFAEINGSDVSSSALTAKQAIEAYGLEATALSRILDTVTYTSQTTGVGVQDLMNKAVSGAPQIKALGISFDEGVALMGQFEKSGIDSSAALSSLSKAAVAYATDGKTLQEGLAGTVDAIRNSSSETEALTLASEVFGSKAAPRMVDAIKRGAFSFENLSGTAEKATGSVVQTYEATLDPIDKFTTAQNQAKLVMADIGDTIASTLAPVFEFLASILQSVADWFSQLSEPVKSFLVIVGSLVTVVGILLPIFLALQAAAVAMGTSIIGLIGAVAPIVGIILGVIAVIALLVVGFQELWQHNEGFRAAVTEIWNAIFSFISTILAEISNFIQTVWGTVSAWWTENQQLFYDAASTVWNAISETIRVIMEVIGPYLQASWENIKLVLTTAWEVMKLAVETAINLILGIIKAVMQLITGDWSGAWETIKQTVSTVWETIQSYISIVLSAISQFISNSWNGIKDTISNLLSVIQSVISSVWTAIQSSISTILSSIGTTVSSIWTNIQGTISNVLNGILSTVTSVWNGIKTSISNAINGAKEVVSNAINAIKNLFNFKISWPHIPLPHFSVSGSANPLDWITKGVPKISIDWYAKGGILTKPTAFGLNGNRLMVGGEAGNEAILPLNDKTLGAIGRGIAQTMSDLKNEFHITISGNTVREEADIPRIANQVAQRIAEELERKTELRGGRV